MTPRDDLPPPPDPSPQRSAEGLALLSLDRLRPVHGCLDLAPLDPAALQPVLRRAITENRAAFARDPGVVPDLRRRALALVRSQLGERQAVALGRWLASTFIGGPNDYRRFSYLQDVIGTASAWPQLAVPDRLRGRLAELLARRKARACLDDAYPGEDGAMSAWDAEVYARMRFYEEFRDPYEFLYLTCDWIDFRTALDWFVANSSGTEQDALCRSVALVGPQTESATREYERLPLRTIVQRNA